MPINDLVNVSITIQSAGLGSPDFGTPLVLGSFTSDQNAAFGADLTAEVTPTTWRTVLESLDFTSADPLWNAVSAMFGQARRPAKAIVGRRATPVAQVNSLSVDSGVAANCVVTINGETFTPSGGTATAIRDSLVTLINAGSEPVTAAPVSTDELTLTADTAGVPFIVVVGVDITNVASTPNVGFDTDLAGINAERSDWYFVLELGRALLQQQVLVETIESFDRPLFGLLLTNDSNAQGSSGNTDLGGWLQVEGYVRSFAFWHDSITEYPDAALVGLLSPTVPGTYSWANQQLAGIGGIVPTSTSRLTSKGYLWLESYTAQQVNATRAGTPSGNRTWQDLVWLRDYMIDRIQVDQLRGLLNAGQSPGKIPYSDAGGAQITGTLRSTLQSFVDNGSIEPGSILVETIRKSQQTSGNQAARKWAGVSFSCVAQGAINTLEITGTITQ